MAAVVVPVVVLAVAGVMAAAVARRNAVCVVQNASPSTLVATAAALQAFEETARLRQGLAGPPHLKAILVRVYCS